MCNASHLAKTLGLTLALNRRRGERRGRGGEEGAGGGREMGRRIVPNDAFFILLPALKAL